MHPRGKGLWIVVVVASTLILCATRQTARADDVNTYVSDQFKAVAKKLAEQFVGKELDKACPDDKPLCRELILGLSDAMNAAIEGNTSGLKTALSNFFVSSSVAGGATFMLQGLMDQAASSAEKNRLLPVVKPLARCVIDIMRDSRRGCALDAKLFDSLSALDIAPPNTPDSAAIAALLASLKAGTAPNPTDVIQTLEALASHLQRFDVRVYLESIKQAVDKGLEGGLYQFAVNFIDSQVSTLDQLRGTTTFAIFNDNNGGMPFATAFATCNLGSVWTRWVAARTSFEQAARSAVRLNQTLAESQLLALDPLAAAVCPGGAPAAAIGVVTMIRDNALFMKGALQLHQFDVRYGVLLLGIGGVLDLVRTGDTGQFDRHVIDLIVRELKAVSWRACELKDTPGNCEAASKTESVCQTSFAISLLKKTDPLQVGACRDIVAKVDCTLLHNTQRPPATPQGTNGACYFPELALVANESALAQIATTELQSLERVDDDAIKAVSNAVEYLASGNSAAARKAIARYAVEKLLGYINDLIAKNLGGEQGTCEKSTHFTTIFSGFGARCAAIALIQGAYYPIADYLWDGGITTKNEDVIANSAYESLLQSKYLAGSPIMLNVGLGANYITGDASVWGNHFAALTVIDKFGLEFFRYKSEQFTFETGPFVGGFLDAIVRAIDGEDRKFWLAGYAIGFPRIAGYDFGVEFHAAAALPFSFDDRREIGFAVGGVVVVPWGFWKEK